MRDISRKVVTHRTAVARAVLHLDPEIIERIRRKEIPKGDPLEIAKMAAIQAAKNTYQLIPYCHQIPIEFVGVDFNVADRSISIETKVKASYKTGVEMEAMTAATVAALTIYDMVKMFDKEARIDAVELLRKTGGKSDFEGELGRVFRAACLVMSDSISKGQGEDRSGAIIAEKLRQHGIDVVEHKVIPDDKELIAAEIRRLADESKVDFIIASGGTGLGPRDVTPETLDTLFDKELPGIAESIRAYGQEKTPYSMLSRANAGVRKQTIIVSIAGSTGAARDALDVLFPYLLHSVDMLAGKCHETRAVSTSA